MRLFVRAADELADAVGQALRRVFDAGVTRHHPLVHLVGELRSEVFEQRLRRLEVVVDGAAGNAGGLGQLADRHLRRTLFGEQLQRRTMDTGLCRVHGSPS